MVSNPNSALKERLHYALCFLIGLSIFLKTLCPTVYVGDSGELTAAAFGLGVPHPTGYPLFMILAHCFERLLFLGSIAFRINLMSAFFSAVTGTLLFGLARRLQCGIAASWVVVGSALMSRNLWENTGIAEVYTLNVLLATSALLSLVVYTQKRAPNILYLLALLVGFGWFHHGTFVLFSVPLIGALIYLVSRESKLHRTLPVVIVLSQLAASTILYTPLRASKTPWINWGQAATMPRLWAHITGKQFHEQMIAVNQQEALNRVRTLGAELTKDFFLPFLIAASLGCLVMKSRSKVLAVSLPLVVLLNLGFGLTYQIPDIKPFFLLTWIVVALWSGIGVDWGVRLLRSHLTLRATRCIALFIAFGAGTYPLITHYCHCDFSATRIGYDFGVDILNTLEYNAEVRTHGWTAPFVLLTLLSVENRRPDVKLQTPLLEQEELKTMPNRPVFHVSAPDRRLPSNVSLYSYGICLKEVGPQERVAPLTWFDGWYRINPDQVSLLPDNFLVRAVVAQYYYRRAEALFVGGEQEKADSDLAKAAAVGLNNPRILNNIGGIYLRYGMARLAVTQFQQALKSDPDLIPVSINLGVALLKLNRTAEALQTLAKAQNLGANPDTINEVIADFYFQGQDFREAVKYYYRITTVSTESAEAFMKLAISLKNLGVRNEAKVQFAKALAANPLLTDAYLELGTLELESRNHAQAVRYFEQAVAVSQDQAALHNSIGNIWYKNGDLIKAETHYRAALNLAAQPEFLNNLGALYIQTERYHEALSIYQELINRDPTFSTAFNNLGIAFYRLGRVEQARTAWRTSLTLNPAQPDIAQYLTQIPE